MIALEPARWAVRIAGLVALLLGILLWIGGGGGIYPLHMLVGIVLVVGLVVLAVLGLRAGTGPALPAVAIGWGILTVVFGLNQATILPGDGHVVVEVAHLLVGVVGHRDRRGPRGADPARGERSGLRQPAGACAAAYSPITLQSSPIMMKKPLNMAMSATAPYGEAAVFSNCGIRRPKPMAQATAMKAKR